MRWGWSFLAFLVLSVALTGPVLAHNCYVVTDPADLQLVDIGEGYKYVSGQFAQRFDILGPLRRAAGRKMAKGWGVNKMPDKAKVLLGVVAGVDQGQLEFVVAVTGDDFDCELLKRRMVEKYGNHWRRHKKEPKTSTATIGGQQATVLPYMERKGELVLVTVSGHLLFASVRPGHYELVERTAKVIANPELRKKQAPDQVKLAYKGSLSPDERTRVREFFQRTVAGRVDKFRKGFEKLYRDLDSEEYKPGDFKTTNEKINDLFLKLTDWSIDLGYRKGPADKDDVYQISYQISLPGPKEAQELKELFLEKVLFYKENAQAKAGVAAMDAVALDVSGNTLVVKAEADTQEGAYNFFFAYLAFLFGYSQADRYLPN